VSTGGEGIQECLDTRKTVNMNNFNIIMIVKKTIDQNKAIKKIKMQIKQLKER
jgi:hypothetical protein